MKPANALFAEFGTTIFEATSRAAMEAGAINLGQGFPEDGWPEDVVEAAARALTQGWNQYPSMWGLPELRQAVAEHAKRFYGLDLDWRTETLATSGATEALAACLFGLIEPGDEVILFEPLYDSYVPIVRQAGGVPKFVKLTPPDWTLPAAELAAAFSPKTKLVLLNSPLNPIGKAFSEAELRVLADLILAHDAYAVCDEVYEHLVFDGKRHIPLMTLPGMRDRALRIGSAGKTFSLTGWKVGYVSGPADMLRAVARAHQFLTFTTPPNLQAGVAHGLRKDDSYFAGLARTMQGKRDRLAAALESMGLSVLRSEGTYFLTADLAATGWNGDDVAFCDMILRDAKVAAIPVSAFYEEGDMRSCVRFCFCKPDALLDEAAARLARALA